MSAETLNQNNLDLLSFQQGKYHLLANIHLRVYIIFCYTYYISGVLQTCFRYILAFEKKSIIKFYVYTLWTYFAHFLLRFFFCHAG